MNNLNIVARISKCEEGQTNDSIIKDAYISIAIEDYQKILKNMSTLDISKSIVIKRKQLEEQWKEAEQNISKGYKKKKYMGMYVNCQKRE